MSRVMVVDDEEDARVQQVRALLEDGHDVAAYADGPSAFSALLRDLATQRLPDVLVLDLEMPGVDGAAFLAALGEHAALAALPVVVVTASYDPGPVAGAFVLLERPLDVDDLRDAVVAAHARGALRAA